MQMNRLFQIDIRILFCEVCFIKNHRLTHLRYLKPIVMNGGITSWRTSHTRIYILIFALHSVLLSKSNFFSVKVN